MKKPVFLLISFLTLTTALFGTDFKLGIGGGLIYHGTYDMEFVWLSESSKGTIINNDFGLFFFLDATYAVIDAAFNYGFLTYDYVGSRASENTNGFTFEISLFGKYPISLQSITIFPLLGIIYQFETFFGGLGILGGIGMDIPISERIYLRGELQYGARFWKESQAKEFADSTIGHGPRIKFGIGYSF